ncbi:hypothetical protein ACTJJF_15415 [Chryseobacterium sp. 22458]
MEKLGWEMLKGKCANHAVKNSLNFRHPYGGENVASPVGIFVNGLKIKTGRKKRLCFQFLSSGSVDWEYFILKFL